MVTGNQIIVMKKIILLIILFSLYLPFIFAQDPPSKATYRITTPVFQDMQFYYTLTFEKVLKKKTIGASLGVKPSTQQSGEASFKTGPFAPYQTSNFGNKLYSSVTIDVFMKFYFGEKQQSYLMPDVYYRLWWFDSKDCSFSGTGGTREHHYDYSYDGIRSEQQQQFGLKILYGRTYKLNKDGKIRPILEPNAGVGLFVRSYKFQTYQGTVNNVYYDYHQEVDIGLYPSLHLNLNIGVEFDVKKK